MKKIIKILIALTALTVSFTSCTGEDGEDGENGFNGDDAAQTNIYEIGGFDFNSVNDYRFEVAIPEDIEIFSSDTVSIFRFVGNKNGNDVWEPIPQSYFVEQGTLIFSFDFSVERVALFLTADFNLDLLDDPLLTDDQIFRFAIEPGFESTSASLLSSKNISNKSYSEIAKNAEVIKL